eukprot:11829631-Heterocapsa_arctica.AAC.1
MWGGARSRGSSSRARDVPARWRSSPVRSPRTGDLLRGDSRRRARPAATRPAARPLGAGSLRGC